MITTGTDALQRDLIQPLDAHNRELLSHVHPTDWQNPRPRERYHLVVIGGGTSGLVTAAASAGLGAKVALIERHLLGGDCLNVGCVPSKALLRAARAWHDARTTAARFGGPDATGDGDFGAVMERMRRVRAGLAPIDSATRFAALGVDVFLGSGHFTAAGTIEVGGAELRYRRAVIATGARPSAPPIPGLAGSGYLTNETVFWLTERPERLLIIGAGPIGCELAQAFARFGSHVTLLDVAPRILPRDDPSASAVIARSLQKDGVEIRCGLKTLRVEAAGTVKQVVIDGDRVEGDAILVATGRTPNVEGLGLEAAGIAYDASGVKVDDRLRTSNRRVYAVGDVCSEYQFTHVADRHARHVVQNALFFGRAKTSQLVVPWVTYTSPEVAHVGLREEDARARSIDIDSVMVSLEHVDRAVLDNAEEGFLRLLLKKNGDQILGATLVAEHAGEMIAEVALAMTSGLGLSAIGSTIHPYPTQAEVFRKAADQWRRGKLTTRVKKLFDWYFKLLR
jgi:pyruvate/2-oxoglutarate dehydrogenase complex dihydrolipoamide dehydrogenase (E3) component